MKLGMCCGAEKAAWAKAAGCDYVELNFGNIARQSEEEFTGTAAQLEAAGLRAEAMNCFIHAGFQLCTLENYDELAEYIRLGMSRAQKLGTEVVVFGSAGARKLPDGMEKPEGWQKLLPVYRLAGDLAAEVGITVVIEPLSYSECNAVNTLRESLALMGLIGHPNVRVLADMYHMGENGEAIETDVIQAGTDLRHCHIARPGGRVYPMPGDGYDYAPFFAGLKAIGYPGRLSIEAGAPSGPEDLPICVQYLRELAQSL